MEEIKKVITIETGKAASSIRELVSDMDQLNTKLETLDQNSEEYTETLDELHKKQSEVDSTLKLTGVDINDLGNYVDKYGNKFKDVFAQTLKSTLANNDAIKAQGVSLKAIPAIFNAIKVAGVTSFVAIKTAIAETGIGLLVIALGEIVAHWQDITDWVGKTWDKLTGVAAEQERLNQLAEQQKNTEKDIHDLVKATGELYKGNSEAAIKAQISVIEAQMSALQGTTEWENQRWKELNKQKNELETQLKHLNTIKLLEAERKETVEKTTKSLKQQTDYYSQMTAPDTDTNIPEIDYTNDWKLEADKVKLQTQFEGMASIYEGLDLMDEEYHQKALERINDALIATQMTEDERAQLIDARVKHEQQALEIEKKATKEALKQQRRERADVAADGLDAMAAMFDGLAMLMDENSKGAKAFNIMTVIMDTAMGITKIWAHAFDLGPIAGPIVAGINTAAMIATGAASIKQITNAKPGDTNISQESTGQQNTSIAVTPLLNQARDEAQMNAGVAQIEAGTSSQDNRVYVVESDITDVQNRVAVVESNATF